MRVIGLISGTSLDAIDAALVEIEAEGDTLRLRLAAFVMQPYAPELVAQARRLLPPQPGSTAEVCAAHVVLGEAFAEAARSVARVAGVSLADVDLIASHGQTVYHEVARGRIRSTLQLGAPAVIAERTGRTVVADFRPRDMAAGGEGAPLVPYLDWLLFWEPHAIRAVQNIGGIGNVTYLAPDGKVVAFDTGPGNVLIDETMRMLTCGAANFDEDGRMAAAGTVDDTLLRRWLSHPFFEQRPPKSTGREAWGPREAQRYLQQGREARLSDADIIATLTALTARSIADAYHAFLGPIDDVIVGGGGARNPALMAMLRAELPGSTLHTSDRFGLDADAKEAVAFAVLGYATLHGWPNNIPTATGASAPVVLGSITPGLNYRTLLDAIRRAPAQPPRRLRLTD